MSKLLHIAALATLLLSTVACSDDSCNGNVSSLPLATFYVGNNQQSISALSIKGIGVPGDSLLASGTTLSEVYLPLRATTGSTSYALWRTAADGTVTVSDTLTLTYKAVEYFHSIECGTMYNFDIQSINSTTHGIDSVVLLTPLITNSRTPALRIHFAASTP